MALKYLALPAAFAPISIWLFSDESAIADFAAAHGVRPDLAGKAAAMIPDPFHAALFGLGFGLFLALLPKIFNILFKLSVIVLAARAIWMMLRGPAGMAAGGGLMWWLFHMSQAAP